MPFVCDQFGECSGRSTPSNISVTFVTLRGSVGRGGRNLRDDVAAVQDALNQIGISDGGPDPLLVVDGFVGPKTVGAIDRFQKVQFPQKFPDGRMDPGQRTVTRLNELLSTSGQGGSGLLTNVSSFAPGGNGVKNKANLVPIPVAQPVAQTFPEPTNTAERLALAEKLAIDAERRITAAVNRMNKALKALAKTKRTADEQQLVREIDWHFKASADTNPTSHMAKVSTVLAIMLTAVREQNLGTRSIFKAGTHPDPTAIAAAEPGGFSSLKQEDRFIIITPIFRTQSSAVIVHELGHFCGGSRASGKDVVHRATPKPFPTGTKREDGTTNYKDMPPFHARTNVFSYLIYCFPELPEFKVP